MFDCKSETRTQICVEIVDLMQIILENILLLVHFLLNYNSVTIRNQQSCRSFVLFVVIIYKRLINGLN